MIRMNHRLQAAPRAGLLVALLGPLLLFACGDDSSSPPSETGDDSTDEQSREEQSPPDAGAPDASGDDTPETSAILLAERVFSPEGRLYYVSIHSDIPEGSVDRSEAHEFTSADVEIYDGSVFIRDREANTMTRYEVTEDLQLVEQGQFSFQGTGLGTGRTHSAYLSPTVAYALDASEWRIIEWDPTAMELTGNEVSLEFLSKDGLPGFIGVPARAGDRIVAAVGWSDYQALEVYPGAGALVIDPTRQEEPMLLEDPRIGGAYAVFSDEDGDAYLAGVVGGDVRLFGSAAGDEELPASGMLRLAEGEEEFDEDYFVNIEEITGSPGVWSLHHIDDTTVLAHVWDPETPIEDVSTPDDYFVSEFIYVLIDTEEETFTRVDSIPKGGVGNAGKHVVDGTLYINVNGESGSDVHAVTADGVEDAAFSVPSGDVWHFERVR